MTISNELVAKNSSSPTCPTRFYKLLHNLLVAQNIPNLSEFYQTAAPRVKTSPLTIKQFAH